jgi:hypothetical protein
LTVASSPGSRRRRSRRRGRRLLADHHEVAVEDPGVDHGVAPDPQHEQGALAGEVGGHGTSSSTFSLARTSVPAGDVADERDVADRPPLGGHARRGVVADLDGSRLGRVAPEEAPLLQGGEVGVHGGGDVSPTASPISRTDGG